MKNVEHEEVKIQSLSLVSFVSHFTSDQNIVILLWIACAKKQAFLSHFVLLINTYAKAILEMDKQTNYQPIV